MKGDYEFKRCTEPDDPERCGGSAGQMGQCMMKRVPNSRFCPSHGGNKALLAAKEKSLFTYRSEKWQTRIGEVAGSENIKDVRQEAGVIRLLIEERLNQCQDANMLMIHAGPIGDLTTRLSKLVEQIGRYDKECGNTLDKAQIIAFAQKFVAIAAKYIDSDDARLAFSGEIMESINNPVAQCANDVCEKNPVKFDLIEDDEDDD